MPELILQTVQLNASHIIKHIFTQQPGAKHRCKYGKYTQVCSGPYMDFGG